MWHHVASLQDSDQSGETGSEAGEWTAVCVVRVQQGVCFAYETWTGASFRTHPTCFLCTFVSAPLIMHLAAQREVVDGHRPIQQSTGVSIKPTMTPHRATSKS